MLKAVIPDEGKTADSKGLDLVKLGQYNQSIGYFDKALEIDSNDILALTAKGQSLSFLGKDNEANTYLDKALAIVSYGHTDSNNITVLNIKGEVLLLSALDGLGRYRRSYTIF